MADEPLPNGWLPPKPSSQLPPRPAPPAPPDRPRGNWPPPARTGGPGQRRQPPAARPPSSPVALAGIVASGSGLVLLVISAGISFAFTIALAIVGLLFASQAKRRMDAGEPMRESQVRAAVVLARVALGLAALAAVVWMVLAANGITPSDLEQTLERQAERMQRG